VLYGCGAHEALLRQLARTPPPGWTIEVRPPVPDFAKQLGRFDLVLMPSRFEGLGLVAVEAAMMGVPVIATNAEGLRDVFPSDYPWLAQPGDAASFAAKLQDALDQPTRWAVMGEQLQDRARTIFAVDTMADGYRKTYLQALHPPA
jgi:glycosyltransferase involved in cell wall biosynthesis